MVDKLKINLENCYGIGKLEAELKFKHKGYAIYAPNGVMKTSFAKTMADMSSAQDLVFPDRVSVCDVSLNGEAVKQEDVFVVRSKPDGKSSDEAVSTLLANDELKNQYENVHKDIGEAKKNLDKKLRSYAGYGDKSRENLDHIINKIFGETYYDALLGLESELENTQEESFSDADYTIIFNPKVVELLGSDDAKESVEDFTVKYDEITEKSPILSKDFQYHNVHQVYQGLKDNNFLNAGHTINLSDKNSGEKTEFTNNEDFLIQIETEKARVLNDPALKKKFEAFNNKLKNKDLQTFRDYITQNQHLLPKLQYLQGFERSLWVQYIFKAREEYTQLIAKYKTGQAEIKAIVLKAQASKNDWDEVISDFNRRFLHLPFRLSVKNKSDVILKATAPSIEFNFLDGEDERVYASTQRTELLDVLSTGEARALYILNIMFEVYTRWKTRKKTLFIFDDVADSFDYKNKFAIIDYLEFIIKSEDTNFLAIILTHNFDFLRTIESREICFASQCRMAFKNKGLITLSDFKRSDIQNPFHKWQDRLSEAVIQIAYIPFLRNVIEYTQGTKEANGGINPDYLTLTEMLHYKDATEGLNIENYKIIFEKNFTNLKLPAIDLNQKILSYIANTADECLSVNDGINLEHKVVLSIATRILAEKYIIKKIKTDDTEYDPALKQMGNLLQDFTNRFNNLADKIQLLKRVNLITPANIHINAFMYEPILDMGFDELKDLYKSVKELETSVAT